MKTEIEKVCSWIENYVNKSNSQGVIVGLSGGIDSAVVAALCVKVLGRDKVVGITLPCSSNLEDKVDGELVAKSLGIQCSNIDLTSTSETLLTALPDSPFSSFIKGNMKARLRMTALYTIGSALGYLVVGTCNKSEIAIGYFTKYGDGGSDFEPIGEFYKSEVWEMAKELGIPDKIINRTPTAGLWEGQTDEDEMGVSYSELEIILKAMLDGEELPENFDKTKIQKVARLVNQSEHKRTTPPVYQRDSQNFE